MLLIISLLDLTAAFRLLNRHPHGICDGIGIHDHMTLRIPCRTANCLNK